MKCSRCLVKEAESRPVVKGMCYYCGVSVQAQTNGQVFLPLLFKSLGKTEMRPLAVRVEDIPKEGPYTWVDCYGVNVITHELYRSWGDVPHFTDLAECFDYIQSEHPRYAP